MSLQDSTIALSLSIHRFGTTRGIKAEQLVTLMPGSTEQIREQYVSASKKLFQSKEYDAIVSLDNSATKSIKERSLPSLFRRGVYLVPTTLVGDIEERIGNYRIERQEKVDDFLHVYQYAEMAAKWKLDNLYDPTQYPSIAKMTSLFSIEVRWLDLGVPNSLAAVDPAIFAQAKADMIRNMQEAEEHCKALLRAEVLSLTQGLYTALQGLDDGTLKRFHTSHVEKITAWAQLFKEARNVANDTELTDVVERLQYAVEYAGDPAMLKQYDIVRKDVKTNLQGCLVELKTLTESCPLRAVNFDE